MAKFLRIAVGGTVRTYTAENIITTERLTATTTAITFNHAQAAFDVLTLTHASDATTPKVVAAVDNAIQLAHNNKSRPDVFITVALPVAVSTAVFS